MSVTYLNTSSSESFISKMKHIINPTWNVKEKFNGSSANDLCVIFGGGGMLQLSAALSYDQHRLLVPASFEYKYVTVLANQAGDNTTLLLTNDKCTVNNSMVVTLPVRYVAVTSYSNSYNLITSDDDITLSVRSNTANVSCGIYGLISNAPTTIILLNYDIQSPNGNYKFYKNCDLSDFTIVKV